MAIKGDRHVIETDVSFFMTETAEKGQVVVASGIGSGAALDQGDAVARIPTVSETGNVPLGLLLCDVVNLDLTRQHLNQHKDEVQLGSKVTILRMGWVVTDQIISTDTPALGNKAFVQASGLLTVTNNGNWVGNFMSAKDENGFAKVAVNLPTANLNNQLGFTT